MKFLLEITTPYGKYLSKDIDFLEVSSTKGMLGILPNHSPLISDILLGAIKIRNDGVESLYATSSGLIKVENNKVYLLLNSIELIEDINILRAEDAKKRALQRIEEAKTNDKIDIARAQAALSRAINRLKLASKVWFN